MSDQEKVRSSVVAALDRTYKSKSLLIACILLITDALAESNMRASSTIASIQRDLKLALSPESHIGRTNGPTLLAGMVDAGLVNKEDEVWLYHVAELVAAEGNLKIDPLLEVARRILAMHLAKGGRCV